LQQRVPHDVGRAALVPAIFAQAVADSYRSFSDRLVMVASRTTRPRNRRKGLMPRTSSSDDHTTSAPAASIRTMVSALPKGWKTYNAADRTMNADKEMLGRWATVIRSVWRFKNIQRTRRPIPETFLGFAGSADVIW